MPTVIISQSPDPRFAEQAARSTNVIDVVEDEAAAAERIEEIVKSVPTVDTRFFLVEAKEVTAVVEVVEA